MPPEFNNQFSKELFKKVFENLVNMKVQGMLIEAEYEAQRIGNPIKTDDETRQMATIKTILCSLHTFL